MGAPGEQHTILIWDAGGVDFRRVIHIKPILLFHDILIRKLSCRLYGIIGLRLWRGGLGFPINIYNLVPDLQFIPRDTDTALDKILFLVDRPDYKRILVRIL